MHQSPVLWAQTVLQLPRSMFTFSLDVGGKVHGMRGGRPPQSDSYPRLATKKNERHLTSTSRIACMLQDSVVVQDNSQSTFTYRPRLCKQTASVYVNKHAIDRPRDPIVTPTITYVRDVARRGKRSASPSHLQAQTSARALVQINSQRFDDKAAHAWNRRATRCEWVVGSKIIVIMLQKIKTEPTSPGTPHHPISAQCYDRRE